MTNNHHQSSENVQCGSDNSRNQNTPESFVRDFMKDFMREFPDVWTQLQSKQSDVSQHLPGVEFTDADNDGGSGGGSDRGSDHSSDNSNSDNSNRGSDRSNNDSDNSNRSRHGSDRDSSHHHCDDDGGENQPPEHTPEAPCDPETPPETTPEVPCDPETPPQAPPETTPEVPCDPETPPQAPPETSPPDTPPTAPPEAPPTAPPGPVTEPCDPETPTEPAPTEPQARQTFFNDRQYGATLLSENFTQADRNGDNRISAKEARQLIREKFPNPFDSDAIRDVLKHWKGVKDGAVDGRNGVSQADLLASIERQRQRGVLKGFDDSMV